MLKIRSERTEDASGVRAVHVAAFEFSDEADLVDAVRASGRYQPRYSVVAEADGSVVGHALLSHADLVAGATVRKVLVLAPFAVRPEYQHRGAGTAMMHECIGRADHAGEPLILLVGHRGYYPRFGFVPAARYGIDPPQPLADGILLARRLSCYGPGWRGRLRYPPAFELVMRDLQRPPRPAASA